MPNADIRTTHLSDAADDLGLTVSVGGGGFRWAGSAEGGVAGHAFTVQLRPLLPGEVAPEGGVTHRDVAATLASAGEVIVLSVAGETPSAAWGEAHTLRALNRGVAGFLLDAATRDAGTLGAHNMPVLYRDISPLRSTGRLTTVAVRTDVLIAGVIVRHGDYIALDGDGFVAIPAELKEQILARAQEVANMEAERNAKLFAGEWTSQAGVC